MTAKKTTMVTFVLDETSSMVSIKQATIDGFNEYLQTLRSSRKNIRFSLIKFNSNRTTKVCVDKPIADVLPLTAASYVPGGMTPLIDACVKAIQATAEKIKEMTRRVNVIMVIQTDGEENVSTEYDRADLAALVKEKTAAGWVFLFLGAGIDAFHAAGQYGIPASSTMSYLRVATADAFAAAAANTVAFAATGSRAHANFTGAQRDAAGSRMPPGDPVAHERVDPPPVKPKKKVKLVDDITL